MRPIPYQTALKGFAMRTNALALPRLEDRARARICHRCQGELRASLTGLESAILQMVEAVDRGEIRAAAFTAMQSAMRFSDQALLRQDAMLKTGRGIAGQRRARRAADRRSSLGVQACSNRRVLLAGELRDFVLAGFVELNFVDDLVGRARENQFLALEPPRPFPTKTPLRKTLMVSCRSGVVPQLDIGERKGPVPKQCADLVGHDTPQLTGLTVLTPSSALLWWAGTGSNRRPHRCTRCALPLSYPPAENLGAKCVPARAPGQGSGRPVEYKRARVPAGGAGFRLSRNRTRGLSYPRCTKSRHA